jgi:hypothetical protein
VISSASLSPRLTTRLSVSAQREGVVLLPGGVLRSVVVSVAFADTA